MHELDRAAVHGSMWIGRDATTCRQPEGLVAKAHAEQGRCLPLQGQFCQSHGQPRLFGSAGTRAEHDVARNCFQQRPDAIIDVLWTLRPTSLHHVHVVTQLHDGVRDVVGEGVQVVHQHHCTVRTRSRLAQPPAERGALRDTKRRDPQAPSGAGPWRAPACSTEEGVGLPDRFLDLAGGHACDGDATPGQHVSHAFATFVTDLHGSNQDVPSPVMAVGVPPAH